MQYLAHCSIVLDSVSGSLQVQILTITPARATEEMLLLMLQSETTSVVSVLLQIKCSCKMLQIFD